MSWADSKPSLLLVLGLGRLAIVTRPAEFLGVSLSAVSLCWSQDGFTSHLVPKAFRTPQKQAAGVAQPFLTRPQKVVIMFTEVVTNAPPPLSSEGGEKHFTCGFKTMINLKSF